MNYFPKSWPISFPPDKKLSSVLPWYQAGGAPAPWGAWEFKGAASEAASLLDLVNSNNLSKTGSPTFNTATGWQGNSGGYLGVSKTTNTAASTAIFRFTGLDDALDGLFGHASATHNFYLRCTGSGNVQALQGQTGEYVAAYSASVVYAIAGHRLYKDGVAVGSGWAGTDDSFTNTFVILAYNNNGSITLPLDVTDFCLGGAVYDSNLTAPQILAVSTALAAL